MNTLTKTEFDQLPDQVKLILVQKSIRTRSQKLPTVGDVERVQKALAKRERKRKQFANT